MGETRSVSNEYFVDRHSELLRRLVAAVLVDWGGIVTEKDVEKDVRHAVLDNLHGLSQSRSSSTFIYVAA